jgi:formyltetrahydrofolate-dependent phosphoribosylglycinamide formyltransferase
VTQRLAVFASGGGSNLQALIDRFRERADSPHIALVMSDRPTAGALARAHAAGIRGHVLDSTHHGPDVIAAEMLAVLRSEAIDLVALAGYLRLVPAAVVERFHRRIVNVHPALLPAFGGTGMYGMRVHRAVLEAGCRVTGPTVHFVDEHYDQGPIIAQWPVPVLCGDSPESLAARVLRVEHLLYPMAIELVAAAADGRTEGTRPRAPADLSAFSASPEDEPDPAVMRRTLGLD